jgi:serine/threonine-protein kinase
MSSKEESASISLEAGVPAVDDPDLPAEERAKARAQALVGQVISQRYRIVGVLAMGGMGTVYLGEHVLMKKRVAVKILHPESEDQPEIVSRFEREAIVGAHLRHPNVAAATDFGQLEDGSYFLVLEYVDGTILSDLIKKGPVPARRAAAIARSLASALEATHALGIVHRDFKPRNVMLEEPSGAAKLIDFGFAKVAVDKLPLTDRGGKRPPSRLTGVGVIFGTIAYLAPEAAHGMDSVDARSDLYALGVMLYEMLAGKHPFDATDPVEMFNSHRVTPPPPLAERAPGVAVPPELEEVVRKLLEKDPYERYQTATEVIAALDAVPLPPGPGDDKPTPSGAPPAPSTPSVPPSARASEGTLKGAAVAPARALPAEPATRSRAGLWAAAAIGIGALGIGAFFGMKRAPAAQPTVVTAPPPATTPSATTHAQPAAFTSATAAAPSTSAATTPEPATSAVAAPPPDDGTDWAASLLKAERGRAWADAEKALLALGKRDPSAFRRPEIVQATRNVTAALAQRGAADAVFAMLTDGLGTDGLDVLYDLVEALGRSQAAERAAGILRRKEVLDRATPALRVSFELRDAPCADKLKLFDRGAEEGDKRTLNVLLTQGRGCFPKSKPLDAAITKLRGRLDKTR